MTSRPSGHWLVYALGGGMGHLTRAISLARSVGRKCDATVAVTIVTNTPYASILPIESEIGPHDSVRRLSPTLDREGVSVEVQNVLRNESFDTLVVDTFPRGIGGELAGILPSLRCRKVLVNRALNPNYVAKYSVVDFARHFDQIFVPGESTAVDTLPNAIATDPWLIRRSDELLSRTEALKRLQVTLRPDEHRGDHPRVVAVLGCGKQQESDRMRQVASALATALQGKAAVRFVTPNVTPPFSGLAGVETEATAAMQASAVAELSIWPFLEVIRGVSIVVGGGGYNTVHETRATGVPLVAFAWPRLYDRQSARLSESERVAGTEELISRVEQRLQDDIGPSGDGSFRNGVDDAVDILSQRKP